MKLITAKPLDAQPLPNAPENWPGRASRPSRGRPKRPPECPKKPPIAPKRQPRLPTIDFREPKAPQDSIFDRLGKGRNPRNHQKVSYSSNSLRFSAQRVIVHLGSENRRFWNPSRIHFDTKNRCKRRIKKTIQI